MSAQRDFRNGLGAVSLLLGLGVGACTVTPENVVGPGPGPGRAAPPATGVEGRVYLTHEKSAENVPVLMLWTEAEGGTPGGGIQAEKQAVPVESGEVPRGAQVRVARTDAAGKFVLPTSTPGGVTIRLGEVPSSCRRPPDQVVSIAPGQVTQVQIDVLCYGPKPPPIQ